MTKVIYVHNHEVKLRRDQSRSSCLNSSLAVNPFHFYRCSFHLLSALDSFLDNSLDAFHALTSFVHLPALQDSLHNFAGVHMLELMLADLLVDIHFLGVQIRILRERDKGGRAVVYGIRGTKGDLGEVRFVGNERG